MSTEDGETNAPGQGQFIVKPLEAILKEVLDVRTWRKNTPLRLETAVYYLLETHPTRVQSDGRKRRYGELYDQMMGSIIANSLLAKREGNSYWVIPTDVFSWAIANGIYVPENLIFSSEEIKRLPTLGEGAPLEVRIEGIAETGDKAGSETDDPKKRGRPSDKGAYVEVFHHRLRQHECLSTLREEATKVKEQTVADNPVALATVEGYIRVKYKAWKKARSNLIGKTDKL